MMDRRLVRRLDLVSARFRQFRFWIGLSIVWLLGALAGVLLIGFGRARGWYFEHSVATLIVVALGAAGLWAWRASVARLDYRRIGRRVEATYPELRSALLAAIEQKPETPGGGFGFLQQRVIGQALYHAYHHPWQHALPTHRVLAAQAAHLVALASFTAVLVALVRFATPSTPDKIAGTPSRVQIAKRPFAVTIEPGSTEIERATSLLVMARFRGPLPPDASLVYQTDGGQVQRLSMAKSLDDPVFGARIDSVEEPLSYYVQFTEQKSDTYHVRVFDLPKLVRADARLVFPSYTSLEERLVQDARQVSAVEGTELTWICYLNKKVVEARLEQKEGSPVSLVAQQADQTVYQATMKLDKSRRFRLQLADEEGRVNKDPEEFVVNVTPNKRPDLKLVLPSRDVQVSPLEELDLEASVWDDFDLARFGLSYTFGGSQPNDLVLGQSVGGKQRISVRHLVDFEELDSEPAQLLSYHFWAEDTGPDGKIRRTDSDMYFAEVRPFEEIFRQGESPPGGDASNQGQGGGNAQAAEELVELQKEIINATWKLVRRAQEQSPTAELRDDVQLIIQSQSSALQQATSLAQEVEDAQSKSYVSEATRHMLEALDHLTEARDGATSDPLPLAVTSEQGAYQTLLKLRAQEHRVIRGNRSSMAGGSRGASGRAQEQLDQLELANDENRYEAQRQAQAPEDSSERETRQVLNRLRDLSRRQRDLNERLKELQSALQEARSDQEREQIRKQLERLRDQEQEVLRDTDELASRMERPDNQQQMEDARQQLDQTRDQVLRASEALSQGETSRAVSAGTRAERQFEELKDEFRKRTSERFDNEMREIRTAAQQLDENQQDIADRLESLASDTAESKSLRDSGQRKQIQDDLEKQEERLEELTGQMREVVLEAEQTEPRLADQLYDTMRTAEQQHLDQTLQSARRSLEQGFMDDSRSQERTARRAMGELREGVERAARTVLGDEAEVYRQAHDQLSELERQLNEEIARNGENSASRDRQANGTDGTNGTDATDPPHTSHQSYPSHQSDPSDQSAPIAGGGFLDWSDRLRDVEEMVDDPQLRGQAARVRDRARGFRIDLKRHSKPPNWDLVRLEVFEPLSQLRQRVWEELLKRTSAKMIVPLDRDPVPPRYDDQVRRYYERLGSGQ